MAAIQWKLFVDPDGDPHIVVTEKGAERIPTKEECERAISILNEEGSNIIRIYCRNPVCKENGKGWIERTRSDISKTVYMCDVCGKGMER